MFVRGVLLTQFGLDPNVQLLNFVVHKEIDDEYKLVVLFPEDNLDAGTIRK